MPSNPYPVPQSDRALTALAWGITFLASTLPDIACVKLAGNVPVWLVHAKMGLLLAWVSLLFFGDGYARCEISA